MYPFIIINEFKGNDGITIIILVLLYYYYYIGIIILLLLYWYYYYIDMLKYKSSFFPKNF